MLLPHKSTCRVKVIAAVWSATVIAILHDCQDNRLHYLFHLAA